MGEKDRPLEKEGVPLHILNLNRSQELLQAVREAQKRLSLFLDEYRAKGVEVVEDRVEIRCEDGTCTAKGKIILREAFGKIQEITAPPDGTTKKAGNNIKK